MPFHYSPGYILARIRSLSVKRSVKDDLTAIYAVLDGCILRIWVVGNSDEAALLPFVVVIRPIFAKERLAMLTLCLPLSDVAILHDIDRSLQWFPDI